jgi:hypothetical protein
MSRVLFLKKGGRERTEVVSMQICSHTILHCDDLAWDRGNPETSDRIFTWLMTGRGVVRQGNSLVVLSSCENLTTPVITSVTSKLLAHVGSLAVCQRGLRPTSKTVYTDVTKESRTE